MARTGMETSAKFRLLVRRIKLAEPFVRGLLETLWDVAHATGNPVIGSPDGIEAASKWPGESGEWFAALRDGGWIDEVRGNWVIHDYWDHAPDYVISREAKRLGMTRLQFIEKFRKVLNFSEKFRKKPEKLSQNLPKVRLPRQDKTREENTPPLPPAGGESEQLPTNGAERRSKSRASESADDAAVARIVAHYQSAVSPGHGPEGAAANVAKLLASGHAEADLVRCADGYAAACRDKEPKYRMKARNFYGRDAGFKDYLECVTPKPMTDEERKAKWDQERQAWLGTPYAPG